MKDDASAKELENLLREALSSGLESPRGATPIVQLKTVPLQVQALPKTPAPSKTEGAEDEIPSLAEKLAPESIRPPASAPPEKKSRTSVVALGALAVLAISAIGTAVWLGRAHDAVPDANAATSSPTASEGAVAIGVAARPAEAPSETTPAPTDEAQSTPAPPPTFVASPTSSAPSTDPNVREARSPAPAEKTEKVDAKTEKVEAKPKPTAPKPSEKKEAKPAEKPAAAPEKTAAASPPTPPAPPAGSVDALLQQQLKGAIP